MSQKGFCDLISGQSSFYHDYGIGRIPVAVPSFGFLSLEASQDLLNEQAAISLIID